MSSDSVTLVLDGQPTLGDLAAALDGLGDLLGGIGQEVAKDRPITWLVNALETGSAVGTFLGTDQSPAIVHEVADRFLGLGRALSRADSSPFDQSPALARGRDKIIGVLNGRVPSVRFETAEDEVTISAVQAPPADASPRSPSLGAYGAVLGRVQTLSNRGGLRFTLYDQLYDRAVSCYLQDDQQELMRGMWDKLALVKGWVKRDPVTGRPTSVRQIRDVIQRDEGRMGDWRDASGALASVSNTEPAEVTIRRLRDAR